MFNLTRIFSVSASTEMNIFPDSSNYFVVRNKDRKIFKKIIDINENFFEISFIFQRIDKNLFLQSRKAIDFSLKVIAFQ